MKHRCTARERRGAKHSGGVAECDGRPTGPARESIYHDAARFVTGRASKVTLICGSGDFDPPAIGGAVRAKSAGLHFTSRRHSAAAADAGLRVGTLGMWQMMAVAHIRAAARRPEAASARALTRFASHSDVLRLADYSQLDHRCLTL
jgi:hypothetical protein